YKQDYLASAGTEFHPGGSVIVDPDGKIIAGPLLGEEGFLIAEAHREVIQGSRFQLDTAGHYARPDVFELIVHEKKTPFLQTEEEDPRDPVT
ncbi:MAG: nitrilase, partial [Bacteroidetes Order II. Incertae sedis bacterium]|nr:nitrilase [Bacteroidetes Order II. bacterium]